MQPKIQVLLVEDHPEYREVIKLALEDLPDIELMGQVGSAERAISLLQGARFSEVPHIVLLDLNLPGMTGLEVLPTIQSIAADVKVIVLTQSEKESEVMLAIQHGASGYLLKSSTVSQLVNAIRTVSEGGAILDSGIAKYVMDSLRSSPPESQSQDKLSPREMEILTLMGEGLGRKEVASRLSISVNTVATHVRRIYEKFDVQNAPAAIAKAFHLGLLGREKD